jgi:hypothetical protein
MKNRIDLKLIPGEMRCRLASILSVVLLLGLAAFPAQAALKIRPVFIDGARPPADMVGGGNLQEIFKVATESWEEVFKNGGGGNWDITIEFKWGASTASWGNAVVISQGGNPVRITRGLIIFQANPPAPGFYADPIPGDNTEFKKYSSYLDDEALLNRARIFSKATGDAQGRIDLLTVATHEIGHLLGLSDKYVGFQRFCGPAPYCPIDVTAPRPFAGYTIFLEFGPHLGNRWGDAGSPLMVADPPVGERQLISALDALLIAELSSFNSPNLNVPLAPPF